MKKMIKWISMAMIGCLLTVSLMGCGGVSLGNDERYNIIS